MKNRTALLRGARLTLAAVLSSSAAAATLACAPEDQRTETLDPQGEQTQAQLPAEVTTQLDSGNAAYSAEQYEVALTHYGRVTELAPELPAGWFGLYMAHLAMGNRDAADSAMAKAQSLAPGASLIHPAPGDTLGVDTLEADGGGQGGG